MISDEMFAPVVRFRILHTLSQCRHLRQPIAYPLTSSPSMPEHQMTRATQLVTEGIQPSADAHANSVVDYAVLDDIRESHDASIPKATKATYATPMKEYREWALKQAVEVEGKNPLEELNDLERGLKEFKRYIAPSFHIQCLTQSSGRNG